MSQPAWEFGRVAPEDLPDFEPIPFVLYGYEIPDGIEHAYTFHARATQPFGTTLDMMRKQNAKGEVEASAAIAFIESCIIKEDIDRWREVVSDPDNDMHFQQEALVEMAQALLVHYAQGDPAVEVRPTSPRSASRGGRQTAGRTSTVVHDGRVSHSQPSELATPST